MRCTVRSVPSRRRLCCLLGATVLLVAGVAVCVNPNIIRVSQSPRKVGLSWHGVHRPIHPGCRAVQDGVAMYPAGSEGQHTRQTFLGPSNNLSAADTSLQADHLFYPTDAISDDVRQTLPPAYVITPTYTRVTQKADLLRMCYTLMHVPSVHWIVVEDSDKTTDTVTEVLASCRGPRVTQLAARERSKTRHRGVAQRNAALQWIRRCLRLADPRLHAGGVYFADDDNTYDLRVFDAVRWTRLVSVWLVGIVGGAKYEGPVCTKGKVVGFEGHWSLTRKYPIDMAAFSVGVGFLLQHPSVSFSTSWQAGHLETRFLESLNITLDMLTPQPDANCSQILAWHTQTAIPKRLHNPSLQSLNNSKAGPQRQRRSMVKKGRR